MKCVDNPRITHVLFVKEYVYEFVGGKRKRSSIFEFDDMGVITKIKERAIKSHYKL
jgi:hypothetical protein